MFIKRAMAEKIKSTAAGFKAVLLTGARQVGKSTLLTHLFPDREYATFDDPMLLEQARREPGVFFQNHPAPLTLDEVQYIQELFPYIKMECDRSQERGLFMLTGSQAFHLMRNVSESLAGRIAVLELSGLSMRELLGVEYSRPFVPTRDYIEERGKEATEVGNLWNIIFRGGYPGLYETELDWGTFYSSYVQTYINRDINDLLKVKDQLKFTRFLAAMAARTGQLLNYSKVAEQADVTPATAKEWTSLLETSGIIYLLYPFSNSSLNRIIKTPKLYFRDTGLVCYLTRYPSPDVAMNGAMSGELFETFVVSEVLKSYTNAGLDPRMYLSYYRGRDKGREREVDLLIEQGDVIWPVEIKLSANPRLDMTNAFDVLDAVPGKKRGTGTILCRYPSPLWLNDCTVALPVEYV